MIEFHRPCWPARGATALLACTFLGASTCTYACALSDQALAQSGEQEQPASSNEPGPAAGGSWGQPESVGGATRSGAAVTGATSGTSGYPPNAQDPGPTAGGNWNRPGSAGGATTSGAAGTGATSDTGTMMGSSTGTAVVRAAEQAAAEAHESAEVAKKAAEEAKAQAAEAKRARIRAEHAARDAPTSNQQEKK